MSAQHQGADGAAELERERAAYEEQLSRITSAEMTLQAVISLLSIGGRRLGPAPGPGAVGGAAQASEQTGAGGPRGEGRDLEQVRDAIDAVMGLMPVLERRMPEQLGPLRAALSQLQLAYARESRAGAEDGADARPASAGAGGPAVTSTEQGGGSGGEGEQPLRGEDERRGPGPAESSGRLWVPGR